MIELIVHTFSLGDVEDPEIYAAEPLFNWQNSESGTWVMDHALEKPLWKFSQNHRLFGNSYNYQGYNVIVIAKLNPEDALYYKLKWGGPG